MLNQNACSGYLCRCRWENIAYGSFDGKQRTIIAMDLYESKLAIKDKAKKTEHLISNTVIDSTKVIKSYIRKQIVYL
jgi:hypothetical protein